VRERQWHAGSCMARIVPSTKPSGDWRGLYMSSSGRGTARRRSASRFTGVRLRQAFDNARGHSAPSSLEISAFRPRTSRAAMTAWREAYDRLPDHEFSAGRGVTGRRDELGASSVACRRTGCTARQCRAALHVALSDRRQGIAGICQPLRRRGRGSLSNTADIASRLARNILTRGNRRRDLVLSRACCRAAFRRFDPAVGRVGRRVWRWHWHLALRTAVDQLPAGILVGAPFHRPYAGQAPSCASSTRLSGRQPRPAAHLHGRVLLSGQSLEPTRSAGVAPFGDLTGLRPLCRHGTRANVLLDDTTLLATRGEGLRRRHAGVWSRIPSTSPNTIFPFLPGRSARWRRVSRLCAAASCAAPTQGRSRRSNALDHSKQESAAVRPTEEP